MTKMAAERVTWVAVLDGSKALLFEDKGFTDAPDLHLMDKAEYDPVPDRDIKTDAPGRMPDPGPGQRSAMEEADFHQQAEQRFVCAFAESLNQAALKNRFDRLVLMASPRAMGWLRSCLHETAARRIFREITGDYTNHPTLKLEAMLKQENSAAAPHLA